MNISEKIEEIRRQPEHIRLRYVWGCVAVSMFVILAIWIFSIASMFARNKEESSQETLNGMTDIQQQLQNLKDQASSLNDLGNLPVNIGSEGVTVPQDTSSFQYSTDANSDSTPPQSDTYSGLPGTDSQQ